MQRVFDVKCLGIIFAASLIAGLVLAPKSAAVLRSSENDEYFCGYVFTFCLARVILALLNDKERREELSRLGIEQSKNYSWEETARKTADVLIEAARF